MNVTSVEPLKRQILDALAAGGPMTRNEIRLALRITGSEDRVSRALAAAVAAGEVRAVTSTTRPGGWYGRPVTLYATGAEVGQ